MPAYAYDSDSDEQKAIDGWTIVVQVTFNGKNQKGKNVKYYLLRDFPPNSVCVLRLYFEPELLGRFGALTKGEARLVERIRAEIEKIEATPPALRPSPAEADMSYDDVAVVPRKRRRSTERGTTYNLRKLPRVCYKKWKEHNETCSSNDVTTYNLRKRQRRCRNEAYVWKEREETCSNNDSSEIHSISATEDSESESDDEFGSNLRTLFKGISSDLHLLYKTSTTTYKSLKRDLSTAQQALQDASNDPPGKVGGDATRELAAAREKIEMMEGAMRYYRAHQQELEAE
ncbi:hypothetical protein HK104_000890, partial [Borealophlyctis nickersoniae]